MPVGPDGQAWNNSHDPHGATVFVSVVDGRSYAFLTRLDGLYVARIDFLNLFNAPVLANTPGVEGYAVCTTIGGEIATNHGYDVGFAESGWGPPTVVQPNGANTLPLTITRTTTDNIFTLKQTFARNTTTKEVTVTMTLTNISTSIQPAVQIFREVDFDVDNTPNPNIFFQSLDTVSAELASTNLSAGASDGTGHGIQITAQSFAVGHNTFVQTFSNWSSGDYKGCGPNFIVHTPTAGQAGAGSPGDYMGWIIYDFGDMNAGATKTAMVTYRRF